MRGFKLGKSFLEKLSQTTVQLASELNRPVYAIPVDIFRILAGLVSFLYFLRTFFEAHYFSNPQGLIDHDLIQDIFGFTRLGLFQKGMTEVSFQIIFLIACAASLALMLGYRTKLIAGLLFLLAVSTYRWNFLVIYVEDALVHLALLWTFLLPIGNTLILKDWIRDGKKAVAKWKQTLVPGAAVRCFLGNLALAYVTAGLWKWTSPMWRDGTALYAALKVPVGRFASFWSLEHLPLLKAGNYFSLLIEPLLALIIFLPTNSRLKWALLAGMIAFHVGIIVGMDIPFANLAMLAGAVLIFRDEIMLAINKQSGKLEGLRARPAFDWRAKISVLLVCLLSLQVIADTQLPLWRTPLHLAGTPAQAKVAGVAKEQVNMLQIPLWAMGVAQQYRLFDWIDITNYYPDYTVTETNADGPNRPIDQYDLFPRPIRSTLIQMYLLGVNWAKIPESRTSELKTSIYYRIAALYCRDHNPQGKIDVYVSIRQITGQESDATPLVALQIMDFKCANQEPIFEFMYLD